MQEGNMKALFSVYDTKSLGHVAQDCLDFTA